MPFLFSNAGVGQQITLVTNDQVPVTFLLQDATPGVIDASAVTYTPTDPAAWTIPAPVNVQQALDQLASTKGTFARNLARVPGVGDQQTFALGPFVVAPQKSGVYLAWAAVEVALAGTGAAICEMSIVVDSVAQGQPIGTAYTVGEATVLLGQLALVTVNRAVPHNWEIALDTGSAASPGHVDPELGKLLLLEL